MQTSREHATQLNAIADYLTEQKLTFEFEFVPYSIGKAHKPSAFDNPGKEWKCLCWKYKLLKDKKVILESWYFQGIGHLDVPYITKRDDENINAAIETGLYRNTNGFSKRVKKPESADVLYCLMNDCDVENYSGFEDWSSNMGYDTDSLTAERIYNTCLATWLKLRQWVDLAKLHELFQDY